MMNPALENNLFDYANYPTLQIPALVNKKTEMVIPHPIPELQEKERSIQEPHYPLFAWEPFIAFLAVFLPLFISIVINMNSIIYIFVVLMEKLMRAH
jgi:hypothetical protein